MDYTTFEERNLRYQKAAGIEVLKGQRDSHIVELRKAKRITEAIKRRQQFLPKSILLPPNLINRYPKLLSPEPTEKLFTINELILHRESLLEVLNYLLITLETLNYIPFPEVLISNLIPLLSDSYASIPACECICDIAYISSEDCISESMLDDLIVAFDNSALKDTLLIILSNYITKNTKDFNIQKIIDSVFKEGVDLDHLPVKICRNMSKGVNYIKVALWAMGLLGAHSKNEVVFCIYMLVSHSKRFKRKAIIDYFIYNNLHIELLEQLEGSDKNIFNALRILYLLIKDNINVASSLLEVNALQHIQHYLTHINTKISLSAFKVIFSLKVSHLGSYLQESYAQYIVKHLAVTDTKKQRASIEFIEETIKICRSYSLIFVRNGLFEEIVQLLSINDDADDYLAAVGICETCILCSSEFIYSFHETGCCDAILSFKYKENKEIDQAVDRLMEVAAFNDEHANNSKVPAKFEFS